MGERKSLGTSTRERRGRRNLGRKTGEQGLKENGWDRIRERRGREEVSYV